MWCIFSYHYPHTIIYDGLFANCFSPLYCNDIKFVFLCIKAKKLYVYRCLLLFVSLSTLFLTSFALYNNFKGLPIFTCKQTELNECHWRVGYFVGTHFRMWCNCQHGVLWICVPFIWICHCLFWVWCWNFPLPLRLWYYNWSTLTNPHICYRWVMVSHMHHFQRQKHSLAIFFTKNDLLILELAWNLTR